ncbi:MAG: hypothetical protein K9H64_15625 [Bacteroidales bacterium]|nr:hypothetical protein [Bacteroidales bacterium]MCF8457851.1 hypothetical protein [Bacteroidales bacterium]
MSREQFYTYLENPALLNDNSLKVMEDIITEYPYFQTAHLLYLKNLHDIGHLKFNKQLRISSSFVGNRKILYSFLHPHSENSEEEANLEQGQEFSSNVETDKPSVIEKAFKKASVLSSDQKLFEGISSEDKAITGKTEKTEKDQHGIREWLGHELLKKLDEEPQHILDLSEPQETIQKKKNLLESTSETIELNDVHAPDKEIPDPVNRIDKIAREKHSFDDWIKLLSQPGSKVMVQQKSEEEKKNESPPTRNDQQALIDNFIKADPRIAPPLHSEKQQKDISESSIEDSDDFITDTLAKIYINQKHYNKALLAYEKLSLKYPEKSIYFAHQIEKIKDLKNE